MKFGTINKEALEELRSRIGVPIQESQPYIEVATKDAIKHFAHGIGDANPLWLDEDYAKKTKYGFILAPPSILYAMSRIVSGYVGGLPGVHAMFAGTNWEWHQVIKVNDRIRSKSYLKDLVEKRSEFSGRAIQQIYETSFENQESEVVAKANSWCFRTERDTARTRDKYGSIKPHRYSIEELQTIAADYRREKVRGAEPRYWEDVRVGEALTLVVKGPLTATSVIAFLQGWGGLYIRAHGLAFELYEKHPALGIPNSQGVPEPPERVHWSSEFAKRVGVPMAYDYGPERVSWLGHLMTNWMGDDGVLRKLEVQVRRFNILGDTTWCRGEVVEKYVDGDNYLVKCRIWAENQRGEVTAKGTATVILPSKK